MLMIFIVLLFILMPHD